VTREGHQLAIISIGHLFYEAQQASELLDKKGISNTLINARFLKPLDKTIVEHIRRTGKAIVIEENTVLGGFGSGVLEACHEHNVKAETKLIGIPDRFIEHGSQKQLRKDCGLDCESIVRTAEKLCKE
jgi:1-deoxy-D-xylulose-5-phosphate synthase